MCGRCCEARRERDRKQVFGQLQEIFEMADVDGSGTLKLEEARAQGNTKKIKEVIS